MMLPIYLSSIWKRDFNIGARTELLGANGFLGMEKNTNINLNQVI